MSDDTQMWETLQCLPDAVEHLIHGDPDDADSVKASDAVKWAIAEIARLREERRWIPVGERLPIRPRAVIANVPSAYGPTEVLFRAESGQSPWQGKWCDLHGKRLEHPVTHWQEMPPGPEGVA